MTSSLASLALPAFDNRFCRELPGESATESGSLPRQVPGAAWSGVEPAPVVAPRLLAYSRDMAAELGLDAAALADPAFAAVFGGNALLPGMQPIATNYGGHQFGHWAGQLGDGRAILLGEVMGARGGRWELQLKGAGPTPFSRTADGRAVLRSSIREFVCSEAMHHLGVPTTRALSLVGTGEVVVRDMFYDGHPRAEPGAVVCRMAPSFIRFGHFELPYARGEHALLRRLADFCIWRDFPHLLDAPDRQPDRSLDSLRDAGAFTVARYADWFAEVCERTAALVAHWMRVGFVHGVLNTDNMSILGLTIDYGPYGWIDEYDPDWTPNTTDAQGRRYRFGWQPRVAHWNLARLAQALSPLFEDAAPLQAGLDRYADAFRVAERRDHASRLGLRECRDDDLPLVEDLHRLLRELRVDMTLWFRGLSAVDPDAPTLAPLEPAFYDPALRTSGEAALLDWLRRHAARVRVDGQDGAARRAAMEAVNPLYVPRNYLAQEAIDRAEAGDAAGIAEWLDVLRQPYRAQPGREAYARRRPDWALDRAGCSMLSCSS